MWISKREIRKLSCDIRRIIDGQTLDLRDNNEGEWSILKNDIHTLAALKNEQVDALEKERDTMAENLANISHQFKTPLTSMLLMAELLDTAPPDKQAEFSANIKSELTRLEWLVSALLKTAKIDAGAVEFTKSEITAADLVALALEPLQVLLDIKEQSVELSNCNHTLICDKRWSAEALTNVLKNASEYSPVGGVIFVTSGVNPLYSWICVTDSGAGLSNDKITKVFERFSGSRSNQGYGIGLPLALAIMRGQNGDIEADGGGNGRGAAFTLKFYKE